MDSIGDNIDFIIERVKLLLKDLFTAHVELAIEAKKWKKKYQKLTKCNETTKSPPFFDVSNQSCDSSSLSISATIKDLITFSRKDKKNATKQNLSVEHFSAETKSSNKSPCFKNSTRVSTLLFETEKIDLTPSPCKPSASKKSYQIMSRDKQSSITILQENKPSDIFYKDLPSDSERDFESPKPFIPSWKRRELTGLPLIVPDTEPIDYEHYKTSTPDVNPKQNINIKQELAMKDTISLHEKHDFKSNPSPEKQTNKEKHLANILEKKRKKTIENVEVKCYFAKSELESLVAENLKEFISPSPDKKKPHASCKAEKKQMPSANIRKTRSKINSQSSHGDIFSFLNPSPIKNTSANIDQRSENKTNMAKSSYHGRKSKIERDVPTKTTANNTPEQVGDHLEGQGDGDTPGKSSFDPDETYCPILREKELLDINKNKHFSPLNNASMIPGLRLSQYCTMDPDQTFDPNSTNKNAALITSANLSQIRTPSPLSQGQMSQELIALDGIDDILLPKSINNSMPHSSNMKFAIIKAPLDDEDSSLEDGKDGNCFDGFKRPAYLNESFDRVPAKKNTSPKYAHVDVVRKKSERNKLDAFACEQCKKWYDAAGLSEEERKERMKSCRHRSKYQPTSTPEHYWSIGFPDTEVCKKRGYIEVEDEENALAATRARRKRAYRKIF